jgi:hypothetical protein
MVEIPRVAGNKGKLVPDGDGCNLATYKGHRSARAGNCLPQLSYDTYSSNVVRKNPD